MRYETLPVTGQQSGPWYCHIRDANMRYVCCVASDHSPRDAADRATYIAWQLSIADNAVAYCVSLCHGRHVPNCPVSDAGMPPKE